MERNIYKIGKELFITSDEEIIEGDYSFYPPFGVGKNIVIDEEICFHIEANSGKGSFTQRTYQTLDRNKKIILTTDAYLIKDGVQAIDDDFLEWFVKNTSCEYAEVERIFLGNSFVHIGKTPSKKERLHGCYNNGKQLVGKWEELFTYKIIITQEESNRTHYLDELPNMDKKILAKMWEDVMPKLEPKQETLEEAVKKYSKDEYSTPIPLAMCMDFARFGAKWQQNKIDIFNARMEKERAENKAFLELHRQERLYSEEEIRKSLLDIILINPAHISMLKSGYGQFPDTYEITEKGVDYIIEQFKKK